MSELRFDPRNYRIHDEKNKRLIRKSLEDCGAGRSILFDKDNCIIAGNGVRNVRIFCFGLYIRVNGLIAQLVERHAVNVMVVGSNPSHSAKIMMERGHESKVRLSRELSIFISELIT